MATPVNADNRPTAGGESQPVTVLNALSVEIDPGDVKIGSVQIQDGDDADEARVVAPATLTEAMVVVGVHDFVLGLAADAAVVTDTTGTISGKLRGLVKWAYERMPAALGGATAANSLPVVLSSDGPFALQTGALTETAPATDTASSGLNGRLQRIAQRLTSLIALLPASLGQKLIATSLAVVFPSDATGASAMQTQGSTAHDAVLAGNPRLIGAVASDTAPANATSGRLTQLWAKLNGALAVFMAYGLNIVDDNVLTLEASAVVSTTVTTSASPDYSDGDCVGGIQTLPTVNYSTGRNVELTSLVLRDKSGQAPVLDVYFFKATPSAGTYTDNTAVAWGTGDAANQVGLVSVAAGNWRTVAGLSSVAIGDIGQEMAVSATSLFVIIVARATWNAASTSDLIYDAGFKRL